MAMKDPELAVRVDAVIALKYFVEAMDSLDNFKCILKDMLEVFFTLMNEIENEDIVFTLETIVEKLGEDIAPFAENLGWNLVAAFKKCIGSNDEEDLESLCAFGCIRAMNALIESVRKSPILYRSLEEMFFPVIDNVLAIENMELFEDILDMISYFVYFGAEVSPRMWSLLPRIYQAYMSWAFDYFECIALCVENFIVKGRDIFVHCKDPDYMTLFNQMIEHAMTGDYQEVDYHPALKLMERVMQHLKGEIDTFITPYIQLVLQKWKTAERHDTRVLLVNVIANGLWYNASLTVHILKQQNVLQEVFSKWFDMIYTDKDNGKMKYFLKHSDKKIGILGLSSLLAAPDDQYPTELRPSQLLGGVMKLLSAIRRQEEEQDSSEDEEYDPDEEDDDEAEGAENDNDEESGEESVSNASSAYAKLLEKETKKLLLGYQGSDSDDYCESDMSSDDEDAPIFTIDPYITFMEMLAYLESMHGDRLQGMLAEMDVAGRNTLHAMSEYGKQRQAEAASQVPPVNGHQ